MEAQPSACPGCGAVLPRADWPVDARTNASPACVERRAEVMVFEAEHMVQLGRLHQLTIDAYGAQHGGPQVPAIVVPFGLVGLHLSLDEGWSGSDVRAAHQFLAQSASSGRNRPQWPTFTPPDHPYWLTIADVVGAASPEEHAARVDRWARSVWAAWSVAHSVVNEWAAAELPPEVRSRIRAG